MMFLLLICVSLLNFIMIPVHGLIQINSKPAKVANGNFVQLFCNVGTMRSPVKWVYGGRTYFSCNSPYTNCVTHTNIETDGFYDFSVNNGLLTAIFLVHKNQNDGIWSCYHGNEKTDLNIDNADRAGITGFGTPRIDKNTGKYNIRCNVQSELPVDVLIYAVDYRGKRTLYDKKKSSLSEHSFSSSLMCSDSYIYCNVTNGYGNVTDKTSVYNVVKCPLKILRDISTNTTLTINDRIFSGEIKIYYEGDYPSLSLYRIGPENMQESTSGVNVRVRSQSNTEPAYASVYITDYRIVKAGEYVLILKEDNITEVVSLNIIYSTIKTTAALPVDTSILDKNTKHSTNLGKNLTIPEDGMFERETKDEMKMMFNVGVAGFVISLLLILILVIVGVVWFKRIQRKTAGSVDQNQVYSTMQTPSNRPTHIYEDLNKN